MSSTPHKIQVQDIDPLGIVTGIIDEIGLVERVDELLGTHPQELMSLGQVLKAMILNELGFLSAPLYLFSQFFESKATGHRQSTGKVNRQAHNAMGLSVLSVYPLGHDCRTNANQ